MYINKYLNKIKIYTNLEANIWHSQGMGGIGYLV